MKLTYQILILIALSVLGIDAQNKPVVTPATDTERAQVEKERTPNRERLYELVQSADRIVVTAGTEGGNKVLYESSNPEDLKAFRDVLKLKIPDEWSLSICAEPYLILYKNKEEIVSIGNVLGNAVKTSVWSGNAFIVDPEKWLRWFDARGMSMVRKERDEAEAANKKYTEEERRWYSAMPNGLKEAFDAQRYKLGIPGMYDLRQMNIILEREYPEKNHRIRTLLQWYGSASNSDSWSSLYEYEVIAEQILLQYPTKELLTAINGVGLSELQIEGAARLFAGWSFYKNHPDDAALISPSLKKRFLDHALKSGNPEKAERARSAFKQ